MKHRDIILTSFVTSTSFISAIGSIIMNGFHSVKFHLVKQLERFSNIYLAAAIWIIMVIRYVLKFSEATVNSNQ